MDKKRYKEIVDKHTPKENVIGNALVAFVVGGLLGSLSELLLPSLTVLSQISVSDHIKSDFFVFFILRTIVECDIIKL